MLSSVFLVTLVTVVSPLHVRLGGMGTTTCVGIVVVRHTTALAPRRIPSVCLMATTALEARVTSPGQGRRSALRGRIALAANGLTVAPRLCGVGAAHPTRPLRNLGFTPFLWASMPAVVWTKRSAKQVRRGWSASCGFGSGLTGVCCDCVCEPTQVTFVWVVSSMHVQLARLAARPG